MEDLVREVEVVEVVEMYHHNTEKIPSFAEGIFSVYHKPNFVEDSYLSRHTITRMLKRHSPILSA